MAFHCGAGSRTEVGCAPLNAFRLWADSILVGIPGAPRRRFALDAGTEVIPAPQSSPVEELSALLGILKSEAEAYLDERVDGAVISLPADLYKNVPIEEAGRCAGLSILTVVPRPCAAVLASRLQESSIDTAASYLVLDVSETVCECSVVTANGCSDNPAAAQSPKVLVNRLDATLGGQSWTQTLAQLAGEEMLRCYGAEGHVDEDFIRRARRYLCGELPCVSLHDVTGREVTVSREQYLEACVPLLETTRLLLREVAGRFLAREGYRPDASMEFTPLVVGDGRWIPGIVKIIEEETGRTPLLENPSDRLIVTGAACCAHSLTTCYPAFSSVTWDARRGDGCGAEQQEQICSPLQSAAPNRESPGTPIFDLETSQNAAKQPRPVQADYHQEHQCDAVDDTRVPSRTFGNKVKSWYQRLAGTKPRERNNSQ